jgi:hypothetical protein
MTDEQWVRYIVGFCFIATLATLFMCIVLTPVLLVIGFSGQFQTAWEIVAAHPIWSGAVLVAFTGLVMLWSWLMIVLGRALIKNETS